MDTNNIQQIQNAVSKAQSIGIAIGNHQSVDNMGAALALYLFLTQNGKKVSIASPIDPIVELTSLVGIDRVKRSLDTDGGDLIVAFPYNDGEIEKVSYTLENGFLNIVVKAGEKGLSFGEHDVEFKHGNGKLDMLFVVGTSRLTDLGEVFNPDNFKDTQIVNIDTREQNQRYGEIIIVEPNASSTSELMANILSQIGEIDQDIAQNLLNGVSFATNNFQSQNVSASTFETVSTLMRKGAVRRLMTIPQRTNQDRPQQDRNQQPQRSARPQFQPRQNPVLNQPAQQPRMQPQSPRPQMPQAAPMPVTTPEPMPQQQQPVQQQASQMESQPVDGGTPPSDWLTPKVYKGSSNVQ